MDTDAYNLLITPSRVKGDSISKGNNLSLRFRPKFGTSPFFVMGEFRAKKRLSLQILE